MSDEVTHNLPHEDVYVHLKQLDTRMSVVEEKLD